MPTINPNDPGSWPIGSDHSPDAPEAPSEAYRRHLNLIAAQHIEAAALWMDVYSMSIRGEHHMIIAAAVSNAAAVTERVCTFAHPINAYPVGHVPDGLLDATYCAQAAAEQAEACEAARCHSFIAARMLGPVS